MRTLLLAICLAGTGVCNASKLIISEVLFGPGGQEFVEIHNPSNEQILLHNYYLSDDIEYCRLPAYQSDDEDPKPGSGDFLVRFPEMSTIDPFETLVIAMKGNSFAEHWGKNPDFEIFSTDSTISDMESLYLAKNAGLTNSGEGIVLAYWDQESDLVLDVDIINCGTPQEGNFIGDKSAVLVDGPDEDTLASSYADETINAWLDIRHVDGLSYQRKVSDTDQEELGENGFGGWAQLSEDVSITWHAELLEPTPGTFVEVTGFSQMNETGYEPKEILQVYDLEGRELMLREYPVGQVVILKIREGNRIKHIKSLRVN